MKCSTNNLFILIVVEWWGMFGSSTRSLQKFALRVLNLTCSASSGKRNWSIFENVSYLSNYMQLNLSLDSLQHSLM